VARSEVTTQAIGGLRERLAQLPDPRRPQGVRHALASVLLIVLCALAADKDGYTGFEAWARDAPPEVLSALGVRFDVFARTHAVPDESTLRDVLGRVDPEALAAAQAAYSPTWPQAGPGPGLTPPTSVKPAGPPVSRPPFRFRRLWPQTVNAWPGPG
jgi:hypothetical protein